MPRLRSRWMLVAALATKSAPRTVDRSNAISTVPAGTHRTGSRVGPSRRRDSRSRSTTSVPAVAALQGLQPHLRPGTARRGRRRSRAPAPGRGGHLRLHRGRHGRAGVVAAGGHHHPRGGQRGAPTASRSDSATSVVTTPSGRAPATARAGATHQQHVRRGQQPRPQGQQPAGVRGQGQAGHGDVAGEHRALAQVPDDLREALHHGRREAEDHGGDEHGTRQHTLVEGPHRHQAEQGRHGDRPPPGEGQQGAARAPRGAAAPRARRPARGRCRPRPAPRTRPAGPAPRSPAGPGGPRRPGRRRRREPGRWASAGSSRTGSARPRWFSA